MWKIWDPQSGRQKYRCTLLKHHFLALDSEDRHSLYITAPRNDIEKFPVFASFERWPLFLISTTARAFPLYFPKACCHGGLRQTEGHGKTSIFPTIPPAWHLEQANVFPFFHHPIGNPPVCCSHSIIVALKWVSSIIFYYVISIDAQPKRAASSRPFVKVRAERQKFRWCGCYVQMVTPDSHHFIFRYIIHSWNGTSETQTYLEETLSRSESKSNKDWTICLPGLN